MFRRYHLQLGGQYGWKIELFFKGCKGVLGLGRYRFEDFKGLVPAGVNPA